MPGRYSPSRSSNSRQLSSKAAWNLAGEDLFAAIERMMGLLMVVAIGFVAVLIAIGLTGPTVRILRSLPSLCVSAWQKRGLLSSVPIENWLVFPFVLAFVLAVGWYWNAYEERKGTRPTRGRRVLSGDEARRTAAQNVDRARPRSRQMRRPF